jgi:3-deoxy-D-manno-octulosonate 8-phosphate phosphatase (KDO 8-P phosphatase)
MNNITLIVLDVDGTLTDGSITYDNEGIETKAFSVKDGFIIKCLPKLDISVIFLTGRVSKIVENRGNELDVRDILQGIEDKKTSLLTYATQHNIELINIAYIGDDLNDFAAMNLCGFKACPADAVVEIRAICDYISPYSGGYGAVRDICEYILKQNEMYGKYLDLFIKTSKSHS